MVTEQQVKEEAHSEFHPYRWGYGESLRIDGVEYPVEWVDSGEPENEDAGGYFTSQIRAVFKVNLDGFDRFFVKEGTFRSHEGSDWDYGRFYEVVPKQVTRTVYEAGTTVESLTPEVVEDALKEDDSFYWDEIGWSLRDSNGMVTINGRNYTVEVLEEYTGSEGDYSADTYVVFKVGDQVFRKTGMYQSHYGNDWDGPLKEVKQVEKTVRVWEEA